MPDKKLTDSEIVKNVEILYCAISTYGVDNQLNVAIEEMSELTKEICKKKRGEDNFDKIADEMADVYIMLNQLKIIFNNSNKVSERMEYKLRRLKRRIEGGI